MRIRGPVFLTIAALATGLALVACFDLLHSTADVLTACELDASSPGCALPAADTLDTDFCAFTPDEAREHALHACAWLGACESPMGNNAFGPCYFRAMMAYDCAINPNHPVRNDAHGLWDCLQRTRSCGDVDACVFRDAGAPACEAPGVYTACAGTTATADVRVHCADGGVPPLARAVGENCALWGRTCAEGSGGSACAGEPSLAPCTDRACRANGVLHWCDTVPDGATLDLGINCSSYGAAQCDGFPTRDAAQWVACRAETDASAAAVGCVPDASASCENGRSVSCSSGVIETLDCAALLRSASACNEGPLAPPFDWTSPCNLAPAACATDSCNASALTSCERGAAFELDCASEGLGPCQMVTADPGAPPRAACTPADPADAASRAPDAASAR